MTHPNGIRNIFLSESMCSFGLLCQENLANCRCGVLTFAVVVNAVRVVLSLHVCDNLLDYNARFLPKFTWASKISIFNGFTLRFGTMFFKKWNKFNLNQGLYLAWLCFIFSFFLAFDWHCTDKFNQIVKMLNKEWCLVHPCQDTLISRNSIFDKSKNDD